MVTMFLLWTREQTTPKCKSVFDLLKCSSSFFEEWEVSEEQEKC